MKHFDAHPADRRFFSIMTFVTVLTILTGFANTYGSRMLSSPAPISKLIHFHALIFSVWLLIFVLQVLLIANKRVDLHLKIGPWATGFAAFMLLVGFFVTRQAIQFGHRGIPGVEFPNKDGFLLLNLTSLFVFAAMVSLGWMYRKQPQYHKRFMLMATVAGLAPPGIARLPLIAGSTPLIAIVALVFIFSGLIYDFATRGRPHTAYLMSLPLVIFSLPPVVAGIASTGLWHRIAVLLVS